MKIFFFQKTCITYEFLLELQELSKNEFSDKSDDLLELFADKSDNDILEKKANFNENHLEQSNRYTYNDFRDSSSSSSSASQSKVAIREGNLGKMGMQRSLSTGADLALFGLLISRLDKRSDKDDEKSSLVLSSSSALESFSLTMIIEGMLSESEKDFFFRLIKKKKD